MTSTTATYTTTGAGSCSFGGSCYSCSGGGGRVLFRFCVDELHHDDLGFRTLSGHLHTDTSSVHGWRFSLVCGDWVTVGGTDRI